jgi:hypothetical protein
MHSELDKHIIDWTINTVMNHWPEHAIEPNFVDVMATCRGWNPLEPKEKMRVTYWDDKVRKEYEIKRIS